MNRNDPRFMALQSNLDEILPEWEDVQQLRQWQEILINEVQLATQNNAGEDIINALKDRHKRIWTRDSNLITARMDAMVEKNLADTGWMMLQVGSSDENEGFTYTIGLTAMGLPEVFVAGAGEPIGHMVGTLAEKMIDANTPILGPVDLGALLTDGTMCRFEVIEVEDLDAYKDLAVQAYRRYGTSMTAVQLLFPDEQNVLPTEEGYDNVWPQRMFLLEKKDQKANPNPTVH